MIVDWARRRGSRQVAVGGGSLGALFSPALAAADERITAVAVFFGAGDLHSLIEANLELAWPLEPAVTVEVEGLPVQLGDVELDLEVFNLRLDDLGDFFCSDLHFCVTP